MQLLFFKHALELCQENLDDLMQDGELKRAVKISLKKRIEDRHIDNCYMYQCSFSTNKDSLCMWNYYTKSQGIKGYNIKFNAQNIKTGINIDVNPNILKTPDFPIYSGKVIYEKEKQLKILKNILQQFEIFIKNNNLEGDYESFVAEYIVDKIYFQGGFFKKTCFSVEEEYRIMINPLMEKGNKFVSIEPHPQFMERNGIFIPYVDFSFDKDIINGITISPTLDWKITKKSLLTLTGNKYKGINKDSIVKSEIPVRY